MSLDTTIPTLRKAMRELGEEFLVPSQVREARRAVLAAREAGRGDASALSACADEWGVTRKLVSEAVYHSYPLVDEPGPVPVGESREARGRVAAQASAVIDDVLRDLSLSQIARTIGASRNAVHRVVRNEIDRLLASKRAADRQRGQEALAKMSARRRY